MMEFWAFAVFGHFIENSSRDFTYGCCTFRIFPVPTLTSRTFTLMFSCIPYGSCSLSLTVNCFAFSIMAPFASIFTFTPSVISFGMKIWIFVIFSTSHTFISIKVWSFRTLAPSPFQNRPFKNLLASLAFHLLSGFIPIKYLACWAFCNFGGAIHWFSFLQLVFVDL